MLRHNLENNYIVRLILFITIIGFPLVVHAASSDPPTSKLAQLKKIFPNFEQATFMGSTDCPDIEFIDLRNVPGYPQIDDVNVCGAADTLSMIIFTGDPGDVKGFEFEIDFPDGMQYGGFEYAQLGGTSITATDPNPDRPTFFVNGITGDSLVIVNIAVIANCEVDKSESLFFDYNYQFTYIDTLNVVHKCKDSFTSNEEFNSSVHLSVLNMLSPLSPVDATITSLGDPSCQTITLSQDGLSAYLDSFRFEIVGLELFGGDLVLDKIEVNNILVPSGDIGYDAGTLTTSLNIDDAYFPANSLNNPADGQMNTSEVVEVEVCYTLNSCPERADTPFNYLARWGCDGMDCGTSSQTSFIKVVPTGSLPAIATAALNAEGIEICGNPGTVSITVTNPNANTDQNTYTDLQVGFQTCDKPNLDVTNVIVGGITVPSSYYEWVGDDINIDFTSNTDPNLGLVDHDGDGFYDDLLGNTSITAEVTIEVTCGIEEGDCANINCEDVQFYVSGKTDCGSTFKDFPVPDAFDLIYGATGVSNPTEAEFGTTGVFGYDFGTYSDNTNTLSTDSSALEVEFCYTFEKLNIDDCPSGAKNYLQVDFSGAPRFMQDIEFSANSASWSIDGGTTYTPIADIDVTFTKANEESATLVLNMGSDDRNVCYKYSIAMDSCLCSPVGFFTGTQQVVSSCSDCVGGCEILKACRDVTFRADPNCTNCVCIIEQGIHSSQRSNFGYTDKTATTKHTKESLIAAGGAVDLTRFLPGDTLTHYEYFVIRDQAAIDNLGRWAFSWYLIDDTEGAATVSNLDLNLDATNAQLDKFQVSKIGAVTRSDIDFSALIACQNPPDGNQDTYGSIWNWFNTTPWDGTIGHRLNQNSSVDYRDNSNLSFYLWNFDNIKECGGINAHLGEGNCADEMINTFNIEVGDTVHIQWSSPLIINPYRAAQKILGTESPLEQVAKVRTDLTVYQYDPIAGSATYCETSVGTACREFSPLFFDIAGEIDASTRMTLDDCGGTIEHTFTVNDLPGPIGDSWFKQEYRPFLNITKVNGLIRAPLAYCANAQVERLGVIYDVSVDSSQNMFCAPVAGYDEDICGVNSDQTIGNVFFNLTDQDILGLGIGFDNCDTIRLSYDLCMICPQDITGISEYDLFYDWSYVNTIKERGEEFREHECNANTAAQMTNSICDEFGFAADSNWFDQLALDSLSNKTDRLSEVFLLIDNRNPQGPFTITNVGANILASASPGVSEEIQEISLHNTDLALTATGVGASVKIPSSVRLEDVYLDAAGTMPLTKTLISDDGINKIYSITLPSDTFAANEMNSIFVGTTLLFCPDPTDAPPKICVRSFSGCAPENVKAALSGSSGCPSSEVCYTYIFGQIGLQTEWFGLPASLPLCGTVTMNVLVKNTKELVLLDLVPMFDLPPGMTIVPGSWEVAYPGGPNTLGTWTNIPTDPDVVVGNTYSYSDDALWNAWIDSNGLQGVSAANTTADSNKVAFRFSVITNCNEFLSGSKALTETTAADPCSDQTVSSGVVQSPPLVIQGADPIDYAQLLLVTNPDIINCEGTVNTFGITAINSGTESTSDSVLVCVTFPEGLDYQTGTVMFTSPAGYPVGTVTKTPIGTATEVCFSGPSIGAYGSMSMTFDAAMDKDMGCGDTYLLADIKSFVDMVTCSPGPPTECGVFVQNSINNRIGIELAPPFIAEDLEVYTSCSSSSDNVELSYEFTINHNGPTASNQVYTVNFYEDVDGSLDVNPNVDNLLGSENGTFSVADGSTIMVSGAVDVPDGQSCPILFEVVYDTDCACDRTEKYLDNIKFEGLKEYDEPLTMCPGSCIDIDICDYVSIIADSIKGATGVEYNPSLDWAGANSYTFPNGGPPSAFITYEDLTDDSIGNGDNNLLISEGGGRGEGFIVASYPCPVQVERLYMGGGIVSGWSNIIHVYGSTALKLEYSLDGVNWSLAETGAFIPSSAIIEETVLTAPITGQYFRISSNGLTTNWATSEFRLEGLGIPYEDFAPVSITNNVATICIPDGAGIDAPWPVTFTTGTGDCAVEETIEIWGIGTPGITVEGDDFACGEECIGLEVIVPNDATAGMTVSWSPASLVDDPSAFRIEACNLTENTTFQATISYNNGACTEVIEYPVTHYPTGTINISPEVIECYVPFSAPILTADAGWDMYAWYEIIGNNEILLHNSFSNLYIAPGPGTYIVKASSSTSQCPVISSTAVVPDVVCCNEVCLPVNVTVKRGD